MEFDDVVAKYSYSNNCKVKAQDLGFLMKFYNNQITNLMLLNLKKNLFGVRGSLDAEMSGNTLRDKVGNEGKL